MQVTYIGHSGFLVELERAYLLFDYYRGEIPPLDQDKPLYVFASHFHNDHFTFKVFELGHPLTRYILSDDIRRHRSAARFARHGITAEDFQRLIFLPPHQRRELDGMTIETLDSTDEGVAFLVEAEGKRLLHMGDLHRWVWDDEPEADNAAIEAKWNGELERIRGQRFDAVFAVLDPRQEGDYWMGLDQLMCTVDAQRVYPMHMWDRPDLAEELKSHPCSAPYRHKLPPKDFYG